jgi:hypothetical protein
VFRVTTLLLLAPLSFNNNNNNSVVIFVQGQAFNEAKFEELVAKMEADVMELARAVEDVYATRCDFDVTVNSCGHANYGDCISMFPNQQCRGGLDYSSPNCNGSGDNSSSATKCSSFFDFSVS